MKTYTFHVTVDDLPDSWRRVELTAQQTLRDLHLVIQEALDWDPDDDISFIVGDNPLEGGDLYDLSSDDVWDEDEDWEDDDEDEDEDEDEADEDGDEDIGTPFYSPPPSDLDTMSPAEKMKNALALLETDPVARAQVRQMLIGQMGVPGFMADMLLNNLHSLVDMLPEKQLAAWMGDESPVKNAAATTLESLDLAVDKTILYVYGEDDWRFFVRVEAVNDNADDDDLYPLLLDGDGPAPDQYAGLEDEEGDLLSWLWAQEDEEDEEDDFEDED